MQLDDIASLKSNLLKTSIKTEPAPKPVEKLVNLPSSIKDHEQDEPLLMENKQRFVLFPIKYHEVYIALRTRTVTCSRVNWFS